MQTIRRNIDAGRKPRKKYRNSNCFVSTSLGYHFPTWGRTKEEAIEQAVRTMTAGREGLFVLMTNRPLTASEALDLHRAMNDVETKFRDLNSFSLTILVGDGEEKRRVFSNLGRMIQRLRH